MPFFKKLSNVFSRFSSTTSPSNEASNNQSSGATNVTVNHSSINVTIIDPKLELKIQSLQMGDVLYATNQIRDYYEPKIKEISSRKASIETISANLVTEQLNTSNQKQINLINDKIKSKKKELEDISNELQLLNKDLQEKKVQIENYLVLMKDPRKFYKILDKMTEEQVKYKFAGFTKNQLQAILLKHKRVNMFASPNKNLKASIDSFKLVPTSSKDASEPSYDTTLEVALDYAEDYNKKQCEKNYQKAVKVIDSYVDIIRNVYQPKINKLNNKKNEQEAIIRDLSQRQKDNINNNQPDYFEIFIKQAREKLEKINKKLENCNDQVQQLKVSIEKFIIFDIKDIKNAYKTLVKLTADEQVEDKFAVFSKDEAKTILDNHNPICIIKPQAVFIHGNTEHKYRNETGQSLKERVVNIQHCYFTSLLQKKDNLTAEYGNIVKSLKEIQRKHDDLSTRKETLEKILTNSSLKVEKIEQKTRLDQESANQQEYVFSFAKKHIKSLIKA